MAGEQIAFRDRQPFVDLYTQAADALYYVGITQTSRGSLSGRGGPLRQVAPAEVHVPSYQLMHERDLSVQMKGGKEISAYNLDYTLPTVVLVSEAGINRRQISPQQFGADLSAALGKESSEAEINAFGAALTLTYESKWLRHQEDRLKKAATNKLRGISRTKSENDDYVELALDVPLRAAHVRKLGIILLSHVLEAHNIRRTDYDPLREMALMSLTGRGNMHGQPYMTLEQASRQLLGTTPTEATPQGETN